MQNSDKTAWIISLTPVTDEPRVRRQADALMKAGWNIVVAGYKGRTVTPEGWQLLDLDAPYILPPKPEQPGSLSSVIDGQPEMAVSPNKIIKKIVKKILFSISPTLGTRVGKLYYILKLFRVPIPTIRRKNFIFPAGLVSRNSIEGAEKFYWSNSRYTEIHQKTAFALEHSLFPSPNIVIAHDYFTAPIADRLATLAGCRFVVDIHEYAKGQYMHILLWRLFMRPWVDRMQNIYLQKSAFNTTVCDGIAALLEKDYRPMKKPAVIRSTPNYIKMPYRPAGDSIAVLYHGIVYPTRGLDLALESVPLWRPEFRLIIRGPGSDEYFQFLREKAKGLNIADRVNVEQPVLFHEIIPEANKADIGYFVHKDISPQKHFTLPNKFFEYIMAGLALCVSDLPEMSKIVRRHDIGCLVKDYNSRSIANIINSFTKENINHFKNNSLRAAQELCWQKEAGPMVEAYEHIRTSRAV